MEYIYYIGVDVSKEWFNIALFNEALKPCRFPNNKQGFKAFAKHIGRDLENSLVVLETTGGYEAKLVTELHSLGAKIHRADPLSASHFIRSVRVRGKSDELDAIALARLGAERHDSLTLHVPPNEKQCKLNALTSRRSDLIVFQTAEKQRLQHPNYEAIKSSIKPIIVIIKKQIQEIEKEILAIIKGDEDLCKKFEIITKIKGIGKQTAINLLAYMPELGTINRRQAASLAGCAPHPRESGKRIGYRSTKGGRAVIKSAIFMAAMAARRHHPQLKPFFERLTQNGKKPMVALTAVMRKLITFANAKIRDQLYCTT